MGSARRHPSRARTGLPSVASADTQELDAQLVFAGRYEEALLEGQKALDFADNEMHPHLALMKPTLALGESPEPWLQRRGRIVTFRNTPWARDSSRLCWSELERETGRILSSRKWVLRQLHLGPCLLPPAVLSDRCRRRLVQEDYRSERDFAPICARYLYSAELRASPYWPKLARVKKLPDSAP